MNKSHSGYHLYVIFLEQKCLNPTALKPPPTTVISGAIYNYPRASVNAYCVHICVDTYYARACTKLLMIRQAYKKARILYLYSRGVFLRWQIYILSANLNSFFWKKSDISSIVSLEGFWILEKNV